MSGQSASLQLHALVLSLDIPNYTNISNNGLYHLNNYMLPLMDTNPEEGGYRVFCTQLKLHSLTKKKCTVTHYTWDSYRENMIQKPTKSRDAAVQK